MTLLIKGKQVSLDEKDKTFLGQITQNNANHTVDPQELAQLIAQAKKVYAANFDSTVWIERSLFTNWTCAIADCKYCYLSTKPALDKQATRHKASVLAEALICKAMGWKVGYITGGLRVETSEQMVELLVELKNILGYKPYMNYGPYTQHELETFKPHVQGMGCAIESFDEQLHAFICPSKPLKSLLKFLDTVKSMGLESFITIILGIGETKEHIHDVNAAILKYNITKVQLCFLKPQEQTVFSDVPAPDIPYMAWWASNLRIAHPGLIIKVALVQERIQDTAMLLDAGVNCFSRYMIFDDFANQTALDLRRECEKANRKLLGHFNTLPNFSVQELLESTTISPGLKAAVSVKAEQYKQRLIRLYNKEAFMKTS